MTTMMVIGEWWMMDDDDDDDVGVGDGAGGGVGSEVPSTLRVEKIGSCLATVVTLCLPEADGGEGWSRRGRGGSSEAPEATSAREAWWAAGCGGPTLLRH